MKDFLTSQQATDTLSIEEVSSLCNDVLLSNGFSRPHTEAISEVLVAAEIDGSHSHGLYRLLGIIETLKKGGIDPKQEPEFIKSADGIVRIDAKGGMSPLSFKTGLPELHEKAISNGIALMGINHCVHATALWFEVEKLANNGLSAIACNPTQSYVAPYGGASALLGTNPIAFSWPRKDQDPFVFDFATSAVARGDIELMKMSGESVPIECGIDSQGYPTTSAEEILNGGAMLPFGAYKGSALSIMIELLAGPMINDFLSLESSEYDQGKGCLPYHGEIIIAFHPSTIAGISTQNIHSRSERLFEAILGQGARLPSMRRYKNRKNSRTKGAVEIDNSILSNVKSLINN